MCMELWQCLVLRHKCVWHCDTVYGVVTRCVWSCDTVYGVVTPCMELWHSVWSYNRNVYGVVTQRMELWHNCVWSCDTVYGVVTQMSMELSHHVWSCDTLYVVMTQLSICVELWHSVCSYDMKFAGSCYTAYENMTQTRTELWCKPWIRFLYRWQQLTDTSHRPRSRLSHRPHWHKKIKDIHTRPQHCSALSKRVLKIPSSSPCSQSACFCTSWVPWWSLADGAVR